MNWPNRPKVYQEEYLKTQGLYKTFTVGYYMGQKDRHVMGESSRWSTGFLMQHHPVRQDVLMGNEAASEPRGTYSRPACSCKILGRKNCPKHGLGQGCATPSQISAGSASFSGGEGPPVIGGGPTAAAGGPSTLALIGGAAGLGFLGLLVFGVI